jgi:hypothetical protein
MKSYQTLKKKNNMIDMAIKYHKKVEDSKILILMILDKWEKDLDLEWEKALHFKELKTFLINFLAMSNFNKFL